MKRLLLILGVAVLAVGAFAAREYRDFTDTQGRTIRGCIIDYDAVKEMVTIERDNRNKATVPIAIFSEPDQAYIIEWELSKGFLSDRLFQITCDKKRVDKRREDEYEDVTYTNGAVEKELMRTTTYESFVFEFNLRNMNKATLKDMRMEYIIFYEQSQMAWEETVLEQKSFKGDMTVAAVDGRGSQTLSTKSVEVHTDRLGTNDNWVSGRARKPGQGDVHGIRVRIFMKTPSGKEVMRELSYPEDLSAEQFPWQS